MTPLASHGAAPRRPGIRYAALGEDFGEGGLPVEGLGMHRRVADDAVALADGVVEAGQALAARGGLDPEAELADLDGLGVQVHAVEVVLEDLPVEVEEGALTALFLQPGVGESDVQAGVAFVNGAEQAPEVEPERVRVAGVAVLEGVLEGFGRQQAAAFAKGAEQNPVQELLGAAQDFGRGGWAEKLKLRKQKAEIASRRARRSAAASCLGCASPHLPRCLNRGRSRREACCWAFRLCIPLAASRATCAGSSAGGR